MSIRRIVTLAASPEQSRSVAAALPTRLETGILRRSEKQYREGNNFNHSSVCATDMNLEALFTNAFNLITAHPIPAAAIGIVLAIFLWKKPGEFFKFAFMAAILAGAIYAAIHFGETAKHGTDGKKTLSEKSEETLAK